MVDQPHTDLWFVERAQRDSHAFEPLFERYWDRVFRFCYLRTSDWQHAEDIASQTFLNALAGLPRFAGDSDSAFRCWLFTIARNLVAESHRKRFRHPVDHLEAAELIESTDRDLEDAAIAHEQLEELARIMRSLPAEQREMLMMRAAGLNAVEIAQIMGKSTAAVRQAQSRTIQSIRRELATAESLEGVSS